jgi:hypothetical protein
MEGSGTIMKCHISVLTPKGFVPAGYFDYVDGQVLSHPVALYAGMFSEMLLVPNYVPGRGGVKCVDDPQAWFMALPTVYKGSYMRASLVQ